MPYININEYDYTVTGPKTINNNIVAVPINAADGPSDKWITIHTYDEFVQMFGTNPSQVSVFGNSWEYAANLLLRGMSVCVRRITHVLDEEGNNDKLLEGVNIAKTVIKVKDVIGRETASDSLSEGIVTLIDNAKHSVLKRSIKGEEINNPFYKYYTYIEDNQTKQSTYANVHILQTDGSNRESGAFADVETTNSEWNYIGEHDNPHYKYQTKGDFTPMDYIKSMNQTKNEDTNTDYVIGDFFIDEANHIVKFSPTPIRNEYWMNINDIYYPDQLIQYLDNNTLTAEHFVDVIYDAENKKAENRVWVYSTTGTEVANHKFVNGTKEVKGKAYKVFESNADLPVDKSIGTGYFAAVEKTDSIWVFDGNKWTSTDADLEQLTVLGLKYSMRVWIPFTCTKYSIDSIGSNNNSKYKHYFNWIDTGEDVYLDEEHPELAYVPKIYWENSNYNIGTRPHKILSGTEININEIVINTVADASKTSLSLQVNGHQDIIIDKDYTDTRLVSGNYGVSNISQEPIKIYGLRFVQKSDNGEMTLLYDAGLEKINNSLGRITTDPLFKVYDTNTGNFISDPIPLCDNTGTDDRWYIELDPGCMIYYNKNLTSGMFSLKVAGFENFELLCHTFNSADGSYNIGITSKDNVIADVTKWYIPVVVEEEEIDYLDIPVYDATNNFNMFVAEYTYPGSNGNFLSVYVKTIVNQGIYVYVYRGKQFLERIELCSFRFRNGNSGTINTLDMELNKDAIWRTVLAKFGVLLLDDGMPYDSNQNPIVHESAILPIYGNYITLSINKNIILSDNVGSLDYLNSLYAQSGKNIISLTGGSNPDDEHVLHEVWKSYIPLKDKYKYDITFVSNGGYIDEIVYPKNVVNGLATDTKMRMVEDGMIDLATSRKDCIAFLDVPYDLTVEMVPYYFEHISTSYAAAYDPWAYIILATGNAKWMPPSFIQLYTHAKSIRNGNKMYLPPAGVRRALVPEILKTNHDLSSKYLTAWQDETTNQYVNPIIWINGYDYTIYGQKTLYNIVNETETYMSALQDLNVRLVANEIKKLIFKTCIDLTFELNNIMTWNEFKSKIEPTLSVMLGEGVLSSYDIIMGSETMTVADLNSGHVVGTVKIAVTRAATDWDINFELSPNGATFTEYDYNSTYSE